MRRSFGVDSANTVTKVIQKPDRLGNTWRDCLHCRFRLASCMAKVDAMQLCTINLAGSALLAARCGIVAIMSPSCCTCAQAMLARRRFDQTGLAGLVTIKVPFEFQGLKRRRESWRRFGDGGYPALRTWTSPYRSWRLTVEEFLRGSRSIVGFWSVGPLCDGPVRSGP